MSVQVSVLVKVSMTGLADQSETTVITTEAFDKISVTIPAAAVDQQVDIAPGVTPDVFEMVLLRASLYDSVNPLEYKVHDALNDAAPLDKQQVFLGSQDALLGAANPFDKLFVSNPGATDVTLEIYVARDVTP